METSDPSNEDPSNEGWLEFYNDRIDRVMFEIKKLRGAVAGQRDLKVAYDIAQIVSATEDMIIRLNSEGQLSISEPGGNAGIDLSPGTPETPAWNQESGSGCEEEDEAETN